MEVELRYQSVNLPVHMYAYLHASDRINIAGLFRKAIRDEMLNEGIDPTQAKAAFATASENTGTKEDSDHTTEFANIQEYQQYISTNVTHDRQTALDE